MKASTNGPKVTSDSCHPVLRPSVGALYPSILLIFHPSILRSLSIPRSLHLHAGRFKAPYTLPCDALRIRDPSIPRSLYFWISLFLYYSIPPFLYIVLLKKKRKSRRVQDSKNTGIEESQNRQIKESKNRRISGLHRGCRQRPRSRHFCHFQAVRRDCRQISCHFHGVQLSLLWPL